MEGRALIRRPGCARRPLQVTVTETDANGVASVSVAFDVNGNGTTTDPGEVVVVKSGGTNTYTRKSAAVSGSPGVRTITTSAVDASGSSGRGSSAHLIHDAALGAESGAFQ